MAACLGVAVSAQTAMAQDADASGLRLSQNLGALQGSQAFMLGQPRNADKDADTSADDAAGATDTAAPAPPPANMEAPGQDTTSAAAGDADSPPAVPRFDLFTDSGGQTTDAGALKETIATGSSTSKPAKAGGKQAASGTMPTRLSKDAAEPKEFDIRPSASAIRAPSEAADTAEEEGIWRRQNRVPERLDADPELQANRLRPKPDETPFAAIGLRAGSFILYPTVEQSVGASSNLALSSTGKSGAFSDTRIDLKAVSDWSLHEAEIDAGGSYRRNFSGELVDDPTLDLTARLRLDIDRRTQATLRGAFHFAPDDPKIIGTGAETVRPDLYDSSASAEMERLFGRASLAGSLGIDRHSETKDFDLSQDYTTATAGWKAGYLVSPALQPIIRGSVGRRVFDEDNERDSIIPALRAGLAFDRGEKLKGEATVGYAWNIPDASTGETRGSPTADAEIDWSPRRGTDVTFAAATTFSPNDDDVGTSTLYEGRLSLRHRLTARTELNSTLLASRKVAELRADEETKYAAEGGFLYWLNRTLAFTGLVRYETLRSETPEEDYSATSARIGIRLQR
ncbi:outer membrane beta-barrel protein [Consotaella salsifontis]|uniref:outer membrane beta-barrel protein n=1 Tax=Consotaella salsifontis TaxID=1365950 RepID=UPI0013F5CB1C|nr:outer membrane beta-barrel protein [Consotaella salsifontis]